MQARLGIAPIAWSNDDLPELGGDTPLETCLSEARQAGFSGVETGGKFPRQADQLRSVLDKHGLLLASGWYSGTLLDNELAAEKERVLEQLTLFRELGAPCIVYGETSSTIQNQRGAALTSRRRLSSGELRDYAGRLTIFAEYCADRGVPLAFHHHMGTVVETADEIDELMRFSGEAVHLLFDPGHLAFAGGDPSEVIEKHARRIIHVHAKDVRRRVLDELDRSRESFLDAVLLGAFTVPGDGSLDFRAIVRQLADNGYQGWFVVEAEQDPRQAPPLIYAQIGYREMTAALADAGYEIDPS